MDDIVKNRRRNLQRWIDQNYAGVQADFVKDTGTNQGELSGLLREKSFGEKKARNLEEQAKMPSYWLDKSEAESNTDDFTIAISTPEEMPDQSAYTEVEVFDVKLSAGNGHHVVLWEARKDEPLLFRTAWFKRRGLPRESVKAMYVKGDSMEPLLLNWDTIIIDTMDTELISGSIYAIIFKGKQFIKEVSIHPDYVELISLNPKYQPIIVPDTEADQFQVLGRMVWRGG